MLAWENVHRFAALTAFVCVLGFAGCGKKDDVPRAENDPKAVEPKEKKKDDPRPGDDWRSTVRAAGGDPDKIDKPDVKKNDTEELLKAKPDVVLKEADFAAGLKKDANSLRQYHGKIIDLVGTLKAFDFYKYTDGWRTEFMLDSFNYKYSCRDSNALAQVAPGQTVTLRARYDADIGFARCEVVKVEGQPPEELSADKLAEAYTADKEATEKKYAGKYVVLKGKVRIIKEEPFVRVALTPPGVKPEVVCNFSTASSTIAKTQGWLSDGSEVKILCQTVIGDPSFFSDAVVRGLVK